MEEENKINYLRDCVACSTTGIVKSPKGGIIHLPRGEKDPFSLCYELCRSCHGIGYLNVEEFEPPLLGHKLMRKFDVAIPGHPPKCIKSCNIWKGRNTKQSNDFWLYILEKKREIPVMIHSKTGGNAFEDFKNAPPPVDCFYGLTGNVDSYVTCVEKLKDYNASDFIFNSSSILGNRFSSYKKWSTIAIPYGDLMPLSEKDVFDTTSEEHLKEREK